RLPSFLTREHAVDRLYAAKTLSQQENLEAQVKPLVDNGVMTQESANQLFQDVNNYKKHSSRIPQDLNPQVAFTVMNDLEQISKKEELKTQVDKSFHPQLDREISEIREGINNKVEFSKLPETE